MKKLMFVMITALWYAGAYGQSIVTRTLPSFDQVAAQEGIRVFLEAGDTESAKIEADGIDPDQVLTEVSGGELRIHLEGHNHRNVKVDVWVTYKALQALRASSAASIKVADRVEAAGDFDIKASSAGRVELRLIARNVEIDVSSSGDVRVELSANELYAEASSAGDIDISGSVNFAEVRVSSSGDFDGYDLVCDEADLRGSSGGSVKITANKRLEAKASSGASIKYKGSPPVVNTNSSSGGSVRKS